MTRITLVLAVAVAVLGILAGMEHFQGEDDPRTGCYMVHVVKAGDTLWELSKKWMPNVDPRQGVEWIREANGMAREDVISIGEQIMVPTTILKFEEDESC